MKILVVEDDQNKISQIEAFLKACKSNSEINTRFSYQSGLKEIVNNKYDLIILDMSMPTFDISPQEPNGGRPRPFAGKEILRQMERYEIKIPVIVLTQFERFGETSNELKLEELAVQLKEMYDELYLGTVYYNSTLDEWKSSLAEILDSFGD